MGEKKYSLREKTSVTVELNIFSEINFCECYQICQKNREIAKLCFMKVSYFTVETAKQLCKMGKIAIPGEKLRSKCRERFSNQSRNQDDEPDICELSSENQQDSENENVDYNQSFVVSNSRDTLNATLGELELSSFKVHFLLKGKRKLE